MVQLTLATFIALVACAACVPASYENNDLDTIVVTNSAVDVVQAPDSPEALPLLPVSAAVPSIWALLGLAGNIIPWASYGGYAPATLGQNDILATSLLNSWGAGAPLSLPTLVGLNVNIIARLAIIPDSVVPQPDDLVTQESEPDVAVVEPLPNY